MRRCGVISSLKYKYGERRVKTAPNTASWCWSVIRDEEVVGECKAGGSGQFDSKLLRKGRKLWSA